MPQQTQHSLVYVLLMWTTLNTIIQIIFITLFFTVGRNEQSLNTSNNCSAIEPKHNMQSQYPSNGGPFLGKGTMITYQANKAAASNIIDWISPSQDSEVISDKGETLQIKVDVHCFLSLQVTLSECTDKGDCKRNHIVRLKTGSTVLLEGWINPVTNSTGLLGKVQTLTVSTELTVSIDPPTNRMNTSESVTHLDIIFMDNKP